MEYECVTETLLEGNVLFKLKKTRTQLRLFLFEANQPPAQREEEFKHLLLSRRVSDYSTHNPQQLKVVLLSGVKDGRRKIKVKNQCVGIH